MSITDELREWWVRKFPVMDKELHKDFTAIADRIDAEHEKSIVDALLNDGLPMSDEVMAKNGWILLPVDADGEYIHIGDVMVYADGNTRPMKVVALVPPSVFLTEDGPRYADMCRHYKPPTVEDVHNKVFCSPHCRYMQPERRLYMKRYAHERNEAIKAGTWKAVRTSEHHQAAAL